MVLRRLRTIFGGETRPTEPAGPLYGLDPEDQEKIGTAGDPLKDFEVAMQRNEAAEQAEQNGDPQRAIDLYERSVAEGFVGVHAYERLATLHERRRDPGAALRVCEAYLRLAASGTMPRGAQRRADRKVPEIEARADRYRGMI